LDTVTLDQSGPDRVSISGVLGRPPTPTTKVAMTGLGAWRNSVSVVLTGLEIEAKVALVEAAVRERLRGKAGLGDLRFTRVGTASDDPAEQMAGSCLLQIAVDGDEATCGRTFSSLVVELALANYPGIYYTEPPGNGSPLGAYWPTTVPLTSIEHAVRHSDGSREVISPPDDTRELPSDTSRDVEPPGSAVGFSGPTVRGPIGRLANARSGDKGGSANVGVWVDDARVWPWLRETMTTGRLGELLAETAHLEVDRYEFPNLYAVNFVVHGLLDGGATEARRFDKQAKALGEWLRARHVALPVDLLPADPG
jgi:hypothetical protein